MTRVSIALEPGRSRSKGTDRLVLAILADAGHRDGVCWWSQEAIALEANCTEREVRRAIKELEHLGDIEVRKAQRGRARINVYRVVVGRFGEVDPQHDRLPFALDRPFSPPDELSGGQADQAGSPGAAPTISEGDRRPDELSYGQRGDDRTDSTVTTGHSRRDDRTPTRARGSEGVHESQGESAATRASVDRAAAEQLHEDLTELGVAAAVREAALADVPRARAWLTLATDKARSNPAGYFVTGFDSGEWPSVRKGGKGFSQRSWVEETSWQLDVDDAHTIVDDWRDIDPGERAFLHELVDEVRENRDQLAQRRAPVEQLERETRGALRRVV